MALYTLTEGDDFDAYEGCGYQAGYSEDGDPIIRYENLIGLYLKDGRQYVLAHQFRTFEGAQRTVERIRKAGTVNLDLWERVPTLEKRFAIYAEREQEVRMGLRAESDLYHGMTHY